MPGTVVVMKTVYSWRGLLVEGALHQSGVIGQAADDGMLLHEGKLLLKSPLSFEQFADGAQPVRAMRSSTFAGFFQVGARMPLGYAQQLLQHTDSFDAACR